MDFDASSSVATICAIGVTPISVSGTQAGSSMGNTAASLNAHTYAQVQSQLQQSQTQTQLQMRPAAVDGSGLNLWSGNGSQLRRDYHHQRHHQHQHLEEIQTTGIVSPPHSRSTSPRSAASSLPSPPDSPLSHSDSLSSFPSASVSVSSSFFFSSGAASPHGFYSASASQSRPRSEYRSTDCDENDYNEDFNRYGYGAPTAGLIIPSLTLPAALRSPTTFGQTLGEISVLLVGPKGAGKTALAEYIVDAEDVVDVSEWDRLSGEGETGKVLRASTDWLEERDAHGLERFDGTKNVVIVELNGFERLESSEKIIQNTLKHIHGLFYDVEAQISCSPSSPLLYSLLSSSHTTLYTAVVYVAPFPLTSHDHKIISALNTIVPVIPISVPNVLDITVASDLPQPMNHHDDNNLASFQPRTISALRAGLFRSPQTLAGLRCDAADRYMRWREVERGLEGRVREERKWRGVNGDGAETERWSKAEWEVSLSEDYARHLRALVKAKTALISTDDYEYAYGYGSEYETKDACFYPMLDPLSVRSLISALLSRTRTSKDNPFSSLAVDAFGRSGGRGSGSDGHPRGRRWSVFSWGVALVSAFCAGVGIGLALSAGSSS